MFTGRARRLSWPYIGEVARSLLGVLLTVAVTLEWGSAAAAIAAGGSAAIAGATALQDSVHGRLPLVLAVTAGTGLSVFVGWTTAPYAVLFVVVVALWCAMAGMLWAVSAGAGQVAAAVSVLLISAPIENSASPGALAAAGLAVGGGLTQVVLVAAWPRQRWRTQRAALAAAYRSVAEDARRLAVDPQSPLDVDPLIALGESFAHPERQDGKRPAVFHIWYGLPERMALTLDALRDAAGVHDTLVTAADVLTAVADGGRSAFANAQSALVRLDDAVRIVPSSTTVAAARFGDQVHEAVDLLRRPKLAATLRAVRETISAQLTWDSPILRHAVRLAVAAGIGIAADRITQLGQGYWVALTILLVLRPETAHTYTRCILRLSGSIAGVGAATAVTIVLHPGGLQATVLAVMFLGIAYAVAGIGYVPVTAALAAALVLLIDIGDAVDEAALGQRIVATVVAGLLAVASHVVLPDRSLVRLRQRAGELLKAEIDYAAQVVRAFAHHLDDPETALSLAWQRAVRARSAFEAASGSARADAPEVRRWLSSYRAALNAVTSACATLEVHVPGVLSASLDRRFIVAVDDYVDALRGASPSPGQAWTIDNSHLCAADQQLRDVARFLRTVDADQRVLLAEVETITRHLLSATAQPD